VKLQLIVKSSILGVAIMATTNSAQAAFEIIPKYSPVVHQSKGVAKPVSGHQKIRGTYTLSEIGSGNPTPGHSFGKDIPLYDAMTLIIPKDWQFLPVADIGNPNVSWRKSKTWLDSINQIAFYSKISFVADWNKKTLFASNAQTGVKTPSDNRIEPAKNIASNPVSSIDKVFPGFGKTTIEKLVTQSLPGDWSIDIPNELKGKVVSWKGGQSISNMLTDAFEQAGAGVTLNRDKKEAKVYWFTLKQGQKLSSELDRWAKSAGWSFMWRVDKDYFIESDTRFYGSFQQAFYSVIKAYQSNGALLNAQPQASVYNKTARLKTHKEH